MALDPDVAAIVELMQSMDLPPLDSLTVEEVRAMLGAAPGPSPDAVAAVADRHLPSPAGPVPVRCYTPSLERPLPVVAFFHGGGWVSSSVDGHDALARRVAVRSGALVVSVDYRLAPEHPFPAAHADCWAVTAWLAEHAAELGGDPRRLAVCGDSAGGNLAASVALRARDEGVDLQLQALLYPCLDDRADAYPSRTAEGDQPMLRSDVIDWFWAQYLQGAGAEDPYAVPARATDLTGTAPAFLQVAEHDVLADEGVTYGERLRAAGVPCTVVTYPGVVHGFLSAWHLVARAEQGHKDLGDALQDALALR